MNARSMALGAMLLLVSCGDDGTSVVCGDGTRLEDGECVADDGTTCGAGTHLEGTECVPDEVDTTAPGPVTNLTASVAAGGVTLTWTNPADADFETAIVVREDTEIATTAAGTHTDADATPGIEDYVVYAVDAAGNRSAPARARAIVPIPSQPGQISVKLLDGPVATVTQQPPHYHLDVQAQLEGTTLTLAVAITSDVDRVVFNPKLVVDAANQGTVSGDGTLDGDPFAYYGPEGLARGARRTALLTITNATGGADPVTLDVRVVDHPMLFTGQLVFTTDVLALVDTGSLGFRQLPCAEAGLGVSIRGGCAFSDALLSGDGSLLYLASRHTPTIIVLDTTTLRVVGGVDLVEGVGSVHSLAADPTGEILYAVLNEGQHGTSGSMQFFGGRRDAQVSLVRLDARTLTETGRVVLHPETDGGLQVQGKDLAITADGARAAVPTVYADEVHVVDLTTMALDETLAVAASPRSVAFSPDGAWLIVGFTTTDNDDLDGSILRVDTGDWTSSPVAATPAAPNGNVAEMAFAPDGTLWALRNHGEGLSVFSNAFTMETRVDTVTGAPGSPQAIAFSPDGGLAYVTTNNDEVHVFDVATRARLRSAPLDRVGQHYAVVSPY